MVGAELSQFGYFGVQRSEQLLEGSVDAWRLGKHGGLGFLLFLLLSSRFELGVYSVPILKGIGRAHRVDKLRPI